MKALDFPLLSDENISPDVVTGLRARGCELRTTAEERLIGAPDKEVLERAADFVLAIVDALRDSSIDVQPPFVVVAERRGATIRVRVRTEPPW